MTVSKVGFGNRCQPSMDSFFFLFSFLSFLLRLVFNRNTPRTIETRSRVPHHHHFSVSSPSHPSAYSMLHETRWSLVGWLISPCQAGRRESGDKVKPEVETTVKLRLRRWSRGVQTEVGLVSFSGFDCLVSEVIVIMANGLSGKNLTF